jgi:hypothetical protein
MGDSAGATALSAGGTIFPALGDIMKGYGKKSADEYKADTLDRAAEYGELKATQTGAQLTRNLNITLGNIDAIRAAGRDDPTSPTGAAVRGEVEQIGTEQKNIQVDSIMAQAQENEANAAYLRKAAGDALLSGYVSAGADVVKSFAGLPGAGLGNSSIGNPTVRGALY